MELTRYVAQLQQQLTASAEGLGDDAGAVAERLANALDSATRITLLEALSDAAGEITVDLAPGSVDVRLRGRDPEFVVIMPAHDDTTVTPTAEAGADAEGDDQATTRTTLRLPESVKQRAELASSRAGVSLNTWLVRAITSALDHPGTAARATDTPRNSGNRYTGWVR